jgi:hypothetical protein
MPDWRIHEVVQEFQKTFSSCKIVMTEGNVNISGTAEMRTSF